ncbi:MAG: hypothetical protein IPK10_16135 [Bacteroidetes bacterium]|nr:hypothetical protein [Bacteroidota bacterium]
MKPLKKVKDSLSDFAIAIKLQQLIASFGDSHTGLNFYKLIDKDKILPINAYWFRNGYYILQTTVENNSILGKQIVNINGIPFVTIADSLSSLFTIDNPATLIKNIPNLFTIIQLLQYFGFAQGNEVVLGVRNNKGEIENHTIQPGEFTRKNKKQIVPDQLPLYYVNERSLFNETYQEKEQIYYIQYNKCWSRELELQYGKAEYADKMPTFASFEEKIFRTLNYEYIKKIVFDLRLNTGGSSPQGTELIQKLAAFLNTHPEIKLYVVIGRNTYSSAILNAMDFKRLTNALFIGEETAGMPNHFGEVKKSICRVRELFSTTQQNILKEQMMIPTHLSRMYYLKSVIQTF